MSPSMKKVKATIGKLIRKYTAEVFKALIPVHFKRIIYLTTLYHFMRADEPELQANPDAELLELNTVLELAQKDARSLILPGLFTSKLWRGNGTRLVEFDDVTLTKRLVRTVPCWLKYADDPTIANDVVELRNFVVAQQQHLQLQHK